MFDPAKDAPTVINPLQRRSPVEKRAGVVVDGPSRFRDNLNVP